jgi:hypothetical protein
MFWRLDIQPGLSTLQGVVLRKIFAGTPPITEEAGKYPLTTAPAMTMDLSPIFVPPNIIEPAQIQQPSPIFMGSEYP